MIASKVSPLRVWASCGSIFTALASVCAGCAEQPRIDAALDSGVLAFDGGDVSDAAAEADVDAHATDAGSVDPGLTFEGLTTSARVAFDVDEPVLGVQLLLEGPSGEVGLRSVDASTTAVISDFAFVDAPYAMFFGDGIVAANIPGSDLLLGGVPQGRWVVEVSGTTEPLTLRVRLQRGVAGVFVGGRMDVDLWLPVGLTIGPDAHPVSPDSALLDGEVGSRIDAFFDAVRTLFEIERGEVRIHELPPEFRTIETWDEIHVAAAATHGDARPGVHLIWTNGLDLSGQLAWGVATGLPGAAAWPGSAMSAVLLDVSAGYPAVGDGYTMAHELGHFAGLAHTTELTGDLADLVSDTPRCTTIATAPNACPDRSNIMFPIFWGASGGVASRIVSSPAQRRIVQGTLLYRTDPAATMTRTEAFSRSSSAAEDPPRPAYELSPQLQAHFASTACGLTRPVPAGQAPLPSSELRAIADDARAPALLRRRALRELSIPSPVSSRTP